VPPKTIWKLGKPIDELLVDGDRLMAVDGHFITYDIAADGALGEATVVGLPGRTAYERVRFAGLGERWVAVLSGGFDRTTGSEHLALLDRATLVERACLSRVLWHGPDPNEEMLEHVDFDTDAMFDLFGITDAPDGSAAANGSATRLDRLGFRLSRMNTGRSSASSRASRAPEERRPSDQPPKASWTGLTFGAGEALYLGWGHEGLAVMHLGGHAPSDLGPRGGVDGGRRPHDWNTRAPVAMTRLKLEAPVEGVVTVPGERGCFAIFPGAKLRWVDEVELTARGERFQSGAAINF